MCASSFCYHNILQNSLSQLPLNLQFYCSVGHSVPCNRIGTWKGHRTKFWMLYIGIHWSMDLLFFLVSLWALLTSRPSILIHLHNLFLCTHISMCCICTPLIQEKVKSYKLRRITLCVAGLNLKYYPMWLFATVARLLSIKTDQTTPWWSRFYTQLLLNYLPFFLARQVPLRYKILLSR